MNDRPTGELPEEVDAEIVPARRRGVAWAWLFPILALAATGWLFWSNWKAKGPEITIHFTSAPGIEPGKTVLIYRGVQAGLVSDVQLDHDLGTVVVSVRLRSFANELAREGTDFWIEKPVISLHEIAGLESIIQGNSIHARTRGGTKDATAFQALREAPLAPLDGNNLQLKLHAANIPTLGRGTPVYHHGVKVGEVRTKEFDNEGRPAVEVTVFERFTDKVRSNSRFWSISATAVSASPGSVRLDIPSLQGLVDGAIAFDQFSPAGEAVSNGADFELSPNEIAARADGPPITISFDQGKGLRAGETRITCLGLPIGLVEQVTPEPDKHRVQVVARLESAFAAMATDDSSFTIIRPSVSPEGFSGLDTLVTGPHIAFEPGTSKVPGALFVGSEVRQIDWDVAGTGVDGTKIVLWATTIQQLKTGAPVYHHGMLAGHVIEQRMGKSGRSELVVNIVEEFHDSLRVNSRFWRVPAATLSVGPGRIGVELKGLSPLLQGGIAFETFGEPGPQANTAADYELFTSEQAASAISEPIRITFQDGEGIIPGKTELRYLGVPVGIVDKLETHVGHVEAIARLRPGYDFLRRRGSDFAIIRPEIDLKGVQGLDTLVTGVYIACAPGESSEMAETFSAVPAAEPALENEPGFEFVLESPSTRIDAGAVISYNHTPVGEVILKTLSKDGKRIFLTVRVKDEHRNLVRTRSLFWEDMTMDAKIGFLKVEIDTPQLVSPSGRISFITPDDGGALAKKMTVFPLLTSPPKVPSEPESQSGASTRGIIRPYKR